MLALWQAATNVAPAAIARVKCKSVPPLSIVAANGGLYLNSIANVASTLLWTNSKSSGAGRE